MTHLRIHLLGNFWITCDDVPLPAFASPRLQSFLAYLLLHSTAPQPRQQLAFQLWPDSTEAQAHSNLRKAIHHLRRALPTPEQFLQIDAQTVQWRPQVVCTVDIHEFTAKLGAADQVDTTDSASQQAFLEEAVALYGGDLLSGCYDEWIGPAREQLRQRFLTTLERLVWLSEDRRNYATAIHYAHQLLRHDPLQESAYHYLMRLHALNNDRSAALQVYHTCATVLQRELGVEPGAAIQAAHTQLLAASIPTGLRPAPPPAPPGTVRLIGRQAEWQRLRAAWLQTVRGQTHFCLIQGEAGIGKTRLAEEVRDWAARQGVITVTTRSYAAEGALAYAPVVEWLRSPLLQTALATLAEPWLTEVARLLPELLVERPTLPRPAPLTAQWQRQRLFEALARAFTSDQQPKLLFIDDLQWCDGETLAWLRYLLRFRQSSHAQLHPVAPLLIVGTVRSEEVDTEHPLTTFFLDLQRNGEFTDLTLAPLSATETAELAAQLTQTPLSAETTQAVYTQSEGNPLFIVEMMRAGMGDGRVAAGDSGTRLPSAVSPLHRLPSKVQAVIQQRLTQLTPATRQLLGLAATIGRSFTFVLLLAVGGISEAELVERLDELWQRGLVRTQGSNRYDFSHDRIREVAYATVSPIQRPLWHRRVAQAIEALHGDDLDPVSAQLAAHYEQAGLALQAIAYYQRAAEVMRRTHANEEAIRYLRQGLVLLKSLPDTVAHMRQQLALQLTLGPLLMAARGFSSPDTVNAYHQARELCELIGARNQLFMVLWGLWLCYFSQAKHQQARSLGEELLLVAQSENEPALLLEAHHTLWTSLSYLGDFARARQHCVEGIALYNPQQHFPLTFSYGGHDAGVCCQNFYGPTLWSLGYPDQALQNNQDALMLAEKLAHPFSLTLARFWLSLVHQLRGEDRAALVQAEIAFKLADQHGFPYVLCGATCIRGWALIVQGHAHEGTALIRQGLAAHRTTGAIVDQTRLLVLLAEAYGMAGQPGEGLRILDEARTVVDSTGERNYEADLNRLQGMLVIQSAGPKRTSETEEEAETAFHQAIKIARAQEAKSFELRATMALCRLWQQQGMRTEAHALLAAIYGWFTEGFDTADLQEAKALLAELALRQ